MNAVTPTLCYNSISSEIDKYLNIKNTKIVAFVLCGFMFVYHIVLKADHGTDSCKWLLSNGRFRNDRHWQPFGCTLHKFTLKDSSNCLRYVSYWGGNNSIRFIGDSRVRQQYNSFLTTVTGQQHTDVKIHGDLTYMDRWLETNFVWTPLVNESMISAYTEILNENHRPCLVISGSGPWTMKEFNGSLDGAQVFKDNMTLLAPVLEQLTRHTTVLWMLQEPVDEVRCKNLSRKFLTNQQIDIYNKITLETLQFTGVQFWTSSLEVAKQMKVSTRDGLHLSDEVLSWDTQILLNFYCNDHMNFADGSCCVTSYQISELQVWVLLILIISSIISCVWSSRSVKYLTCIPQGRVTVIVIYVFLCDRTLFFLKSNRYYTSWSYYLPVIYLFVLGVFFTDKSTEPTIMNRDQTDEWKGWIQLLLLINHLTGTVQPSFIASSYLFMSAFGHFTYFLYKEDFTLHRLCVVLYRYNILALTLSLVLGRPYQSYHFLSLVSFWFIVLYIMMSAWPRTTVTQLEKEDMGSLTVAGRPSFVLLTKTVVILAIVAIISSSEVVFDLVFLRNPFNNLFISPDQTIQAWTLTWQLDKYTTLFGVVFGYLLHMTKNAKEGGNHLQWVIRIVTITGILVLFGCRSTTKCSSFSSQLGVLVVLCFASLRNACTWLQSRYSSFFAWFGRISLELYVLHHHILLSSNDQTVLVLLPHYPLLNLIITSFIFVSVAHETHQLTRILQPYIVPQEVTLLVRNLTVSAGITIIMRIFE